MIDDRIAAALAKHDSIQRAATGQFIGQIRKQLREEFAEALGQLRADIAKQRTHNG